MKEFLLIFRFEDNNYLKPSPEQIQKITNWLGCIGVENSLYGNLIYYILKTEKK